MSRRIPTSQKQTINKDPETLLATNRRLLVELQALSSRINAVNEIATAINRTLDLDEILQLVGQQSKWLFDFDHCSVYLQQVDGLGRFVTLFGQNVPADTWKWVYEQLIKTAIQTKQSQLIHQATEIENFPYPSQISIPLQSEGEVLGTIQFANMQIALYTQEDLRIGYLLALQLAGAIRNARRFRESRQLYSQLEKAYASLRQAEQMRDDLTHMIIHDLRNPLSVIDISLGFIQELLDKPTNDKAVRAFTHAKSASQRMVQMVEELLDVNKLDAGELKLVLQPVDFAVLLKEKGIVYQTQAEKQEKTFQIVSQPDLPLVMADLSLISRVIDNLVSNALKYTVSGEWIKISASIQGVLLYISVGDNGSGVPVEYQERIFDKFVQVVDEKGVPLRKGTGLGLTFCRLVVEAHNGRIWVESELEKGSTFVFTLPLNQPELLL